MSKDFRGGLCTLFRIGVARALLAAAGLGLRPDFALLTALHRQVANSEACRPPGLTRAACIITPFAAVLPRSVLKLDGLLTPYYNDA